MRNPVLLEIIAKKFYEFNNNETLQKCFSEIIPKDPNNLSVDIAIFKWGPELKERLPSIRGRLLQDNGIPHPEILKTVDAIDRNFLFPGY